MTRKRARISRRPGTTSNRNWISLQEQVGFLFPKLNRKSFILLYEECDEQAMRLLVVTEHKARFEPLLPIGDSR